LQPFEDFTPTQTILQELVRSTLFIAPKYLLAKRTTLECPKAHIEREANKPIKHTLCKRDRAELLHSEFKTSKVCCKNSIDFLHAELAVIL
jgi:hypothetical protein